MSSSKVAGGIGALRAALGVALLVAPRPSLAALGFTGADGPTITIARLAGTRDLALGALGLAARHDRRRLAEVTTVGAAVDAADAASFAIALARGEAPTRGAAIGITTAAQAAFLGAVIARRLTVADR